MSLSTASQNTVSQRPTWIDLSARRAIANQLIEFVLGQLPSFSKLGKKEIAQLNSPMPVELAANVTLTGLSRSTRGITWGEPRKCLLVKFTYFTGMVDTRTIELKEEVVAPAIEVPEVEEVKEITLVAEVVETVEQSINLIEALPAIYTINQPTQREIDSLVSWVKREGKVSYFDASVVLESAVIAAALKAGLLVETNNVLSLPVVEVAVAPAAEPTDLIAEQIEQGQQSADPAYRQHAQMLKDCTQGDWLDQVVAEIEADQQQPDSQEDNLDTLELPGLKCKNLDRPGDNYWIFVGERFSAFAAVAWLAELGVYTSAKPNGQTGCYKVIVPRWVRGSLLPAVQAQRSQAA